MQAEQPVARAVQDRVIQTPTKLEFRKKAPAVEVKTSVEAIKEEARVQPSQDVDTHEAFNQKF